MSDCKIPQELRNLPQWVCCYSDSKIPMVAGSLNSTASSTDPDTWRDFETATQAVSSGRFDYLGFVFNDNGIVGIDIDDGYDDGLLSPLACDIIGKCKSYTEKSKSGRGFHIFVKGDIPFKGKNNLKGVEIYKQSRFFITTGNSLIYDTIVENQEAIDYILNKYFPNERPSSGDTHTTISRIYTPLWKPTDSDKIRLRPIYPRIPDGCRNICLASLAGMLHNIGYSAEQIYDEISYCNCVACDPVLPEQEVVCIVNSITRYKR